MGFDGLMDEISKEEQIDTTPAIVSETIALGNELINVDFLPKLAKVKVLKKYLKDIKHLNIYKHGWRFQFGKSREWAGLCSAEETTAAKAKDKNIYVSIDFVKHDKNWKENMAQTIHHEISHAIVREIFKGMSGHFILMKIDEYHQVTKGHGKIWQLICKKIFGSECNMYYNNANFGDSFKPYFYDCGKCENIEYGVSPSFVTNCTKCGNAIIVQQN